MTEPNPITPSPPTTPDPTPPRGFTVRRRAISVLILACLGLQLSVFAPKIDAVLPHFPYYPFLKYNMYADAHTGVPTTTRSRIEATLADGSVVPCMPDDIGLQFFVWRYHYAEAMMAAKHQDGIAAAPYDPPADWTMQDNTKADNDQINGEAWRDARNLAQRAADLYRQPVTEVRILTTTYRLIESDLQESEQTIVFAFDPPLVPGPDGGGQP